MARGTHKPEIPAEFAVYPRDMVGYGARPPHPHWPANARLALQFVINYEEGGENSILHGDGASEAFLTETVGAQPLPGRRPVNTESVYEYGSRADKPQLIIPYTLDANDMRFAAMQGFNSGDQFYAYLRDAFDTLYAEGEATPKMMSVGLHCRLVGRPGRIAALSRFIAHVQQHPKVWVCRRIDIARHWRNQHPYRPAAD